MPARWLPEHKNDVEERTAAAKLRQHFRRMGFERLGRTPYYALPTAITTPTAEELLALQRWGLLGHDRSPR